jgi:hypothetical protein
VERLTEKQIEIEKLQEGRAHILADFEALKAKQ